MNFKLILTLSLSGFLIALATAFFVPPRIEPWFWVTVAAISAYYISKDATGRYFLHGFLVSIVNSVWMVIVHLAFAARYLASHTREAAEYAQITGGTGLSFLKAMLILEPVKGVLTGILFGLFAVLANIVVKR